MNQAAGSCKADAYNIFSFNPQEFSTPDSKGFFGPFGGRYVPEGAIPVLDELEKAFQHFIADPAFLAEFNGLLRDYAGRETPLFHCRNLSRLLGGAQIYLKREDLNHLGAHKVNNALGQALLAQRMGKKRVIAETGAGQHGVATAAVAALLGMECVIYMGEEDTRRQALNVFRMQMMGARVESVTRGQRTLKEAVDVAIEDWLAHAGDTFYILGSAVGPHPYPLIVRAFQSVIGKEARTQMLAMTGNLPDCVVACVGGGSNAIGIFSGFVKDEGVRLIGVEPGGRGLNMGEHAATMSFGKPGVLHGFRSLLLQDGQGEPAPVYSISAGLDYPGVGPEHAALQAEGRAEYLLADDREAVEAFLTLSRTEGIIPALESSHALAQAMRLAENMPQESTVLVCLSGRGDKDVEQVAALLRDNPDFPRHKRTR